MQNLTRRAALAAVPALAAIPAMAATTNVDPLALSPRFVGPFANWRACKDAGDSDNAKADRLQAASEAREGIVNPMGHHNFPEDIPMWDAYLAKTRALPERAEIDRLNELASDQWGRAWQYVYELLDLDPATLGDLVAQLEAYIGSATPEDIDEKVFREAPANIRRLVVAS